MIVAWFIRDLRNVVRAASNSLYYSGMRSSGRFGVKGEINRSWVRVGQGKGRRIMILR